MSSIAASEVRLAELVASMWLATDLGLGQPMEHVAAVVRVGPPTQLADVVSHEGVSEDARTRGARRPSSARWARPSARRNAEGK